MSHFGLKDFLDDIGCNLIVGVYGLNVLTPERLSGPISTKSMTWRVSCGYLHGLFLLILQRLCICSYCA